MMYRVRKCRDGQFYVQEKAAPGLAGGIWRRAKPAGEFCRYCGASIPHRPGEGRCHVCALVAND